VVLFESWHGSYSDNPRALSEALAANRPDIDQIWALHDRSTAPPWATVVEPGSRGYLRYLGQAGTIVTNTNLPRYFRKREQTFVLQTWHGTPLKQIAFDIPDQNFTGSRQYLRGLAREVLAWDALISPNAFSTEIFRRAFHYRGAVIESGYPRNDVLAGRKVTEVGRGVRRTLGIGEERVVLYAPTMRDDRPTFDAFDADLLRRRLGNECVILVRAHPREPAPEGTAGGNVRDVSDHPDIRDLYAIADVLVTDYSSAMFDFAVTRRPMLFFTHDLERYRDRERGFYFDFEADSPGPLVPTMDELASALADVEAATKSYDLRYAEFFAKYCSLEDGHASERVIDAVFGDETDRSPVFAVAPGAASAAQLLL
jgi:CDP-glycerol glycerophosphotransferase